MGAPRTRGAVRGWGAVVVVALLVGCGGSEVSEAGRASAVAAGPDGSLVAGTGLLAAIPDSTFGRLVETLSEPERYFDTDNLISNESSYLHVMGALEERGVRGGVYMGVGPGQNFSYMAAIRPSLAFLIDIRRDNLLQHLWYKALFEAAPTRLDYLCLMVARSCGGASETLTLEALVERVDGAAPVDTAEAVMEALADRAASAGVALTSDDRTTIRSIHARFARHGLGLRFSSHGRAPRADYPTLRRLLLESDRDGARVNYLADEADYRYLRALQRANRVVPVVGDLAGDHAVRAIAAEVAERGEVVSAVYTSNVEFYLFGDGVFARWMRNLAALPVAEDAVVIRSYFNRWRTIPETVPGYASTQLLESIPALLAAWEEGRIRSYAGLVGR